MTCASDRGLPGGVGIVGRYPRVGGRASTDRRSVTELCRISGLFVRLPPEILFLTGPRSDNLRPIAALVEKLSRIVTTSSDTASIDPD